jgi:exodeoxyribonuclease-3
MKLATWNVNSIKVRGPAVQDWLKTHAVDALLLQELKGENFPVEDFKAAGYETVFVGQKAYNGVAILSKKPVTMVLNRLPGSDDDEQARYLEVDLDGIRVINIYLPNGNPVPGDKYAYKLSWMSRLYGRLKQLTEEEIPFVIGGDFNVIPEAKDCYDPKVWINDALYLLETRQKFRSLLNLGLTDAFRVFNTGAGHYSFWDYQAGCWPQNKGIRIDHFLLSPPLADRLQSCIIDKEPRGLDNPSDHTPVILELRS